MPGSATIGGLEVWTAEIKLRASVRIGELVRELDKERPGPAAADTSRQRDTTPKREAIRDAGLSKSTANRYEGLAGPRDEDLQAAGKAAAEEYFARARAEREPATMDGLRGAVKDAVEGVAHNHRAQGGTLYRDGGRYRHSGPRDCYAAPAKRCRGWTTIPEAPAPRLAPLL